ncbi:hypothetical protein AVHM3334_00250 [Acidovorax sp. SUPP3334]|nr:hypothetical protein AVHM3334_00250 [Acidovorax sp. SUPP3334]
MKRDGRTLAHNVLEEMRMLADRPPAQPHTRAGAPGFSLGQRQKPTSGFRADAVHGKTWGAKGQTPVVERPGQRQSISAASAVNSKGAFWFETYQGALTGELFVQLLKNMMAEREKPVHLVVDGLPAHKKALVKQYVASTAGALTLHFLPGYAPDLNPDELVWSHAKRTGVARSPLRKGDKLKERVDAQLQSVAEDPALIRSFFRHPSVAYISDF